MLSPEICSFLWQICIEHLFCAWHGARNWGYSNDSALRDKSPSPPDTKLLQWPRPGVRAVRGLRKELRSPQRERVDLGPKRRKVLTVTKKQPSWGGDPAYAPTVARGD